MRLEFHPGIDSDLRSMVAFYDNESLWAAERFIVEFRHALEGIRKNPARHHFVDPERRRCNVKGFPYHLIYEVGADVVNVLVVRHHRRRPDYGMQRKMQ